MNAIQFLAVISLVAVFFVAIGAQQIFFWRAKRHQKEEKIQEAVREARVAERARVKQVRRIARQDKLGDQIFWSLYETWKSAGRPKNLEPRRIRHNFGSAEEGGYYIEVGRDGRDPIDAIFWVTLDLRRIGKEISVTGDHLLLDGRYREFPASDGVGFICSVLAGRVFSP